MFVEAYDFPLSSPSNVVSPIGYPLLSALTKLVPGLHSRPALQIAPVYMMGVNGSARFCEKSFLHIRGINMPEAHRISGASILVGNSPVQIGEILQRRLYPVQDLRSGLVIFRGVVDHDKFERKVRSLVPPFVSVGVDRKSKVLKVKNMHLAGFGVTLRNLDEEASYHLLDNGLGKMTSMGAGVFKELR